MTTAQAPEPRGKVAAARPAPRRSLGIAILAAYLVAAGFLTLVMALYGVRQDHYTIEDSGKSITLDLGDTFKVELSSALSGPNWVVESPRSAFPPWQQRQYNPAEPVAVIEYVGIQEDCKHDFHGFPYDCGLSTYTFRAAGPGQADLRMENTVFRGWTFTLHVTVK